METIFAAEAARVKPPRRALFVQTARERSDPALSPVPTPADAVSALAATPPFKVTVLGSGTSMGVPVINCDCAVCTSTDPRNNRMRASVKIDIAGKTLLIDCGTDLYRQMLRFRTPRIDAVLLTHNHADHLHGLDDLRAFCFHQSEPIPFLSAPEFIEDVKSRFGYCFNPPQKGGGVPQLELREIEPGRPAQVHGVTVLPLEIIHGRIPILGFRIGNFAYLTDCSEIPEATWPLLEGVETLIVSGLRWETHSTHFSVGEAVEAAKRMGVKNAWLIHMTHDLDHAETEAKLPEFVRLTYDGLEIEVP